MVYALQGDYTLSQGYVENFVADDASPDFDCLSDMGLSSERTKASSMYFAANNVSDAEYGTGRWF